MIRLNNINRLQLFCLENYKTAKGISGKNALEEFKKHGIFVFISNNYEVLHTQGKNYILDEINHYMNNRR